MKTKILADPINKVILQGVVSNKREYEVDGKQKHTFLLISNNTLIDTDKGNATVYYMPIVVELHSKEIYDILEEGSIVTVEGKLRYNSKTGRYKVISNYVKFITNKSVTVDIPIDGIFYQEKED